MTFALGPRLLGEEAPDQKKDDDDEQQQNGHADHQEDGDADEQTSLLPRSVINGVSTATNKTHAKAHGFYERLPPRGQTFVDVASGFVNAPLIGAIIGAIIGLTPPLHKAFFNNQEEGGFLNSWLTASIKNTGELFVALQVIVVGVKLSSCLRKMKRGEESGDVPWVAMTTVLLIRFVLWSAISIPVIYLLASRTAWISNDPILWFTLMLMPTGPPAMKLTAMADVTGASEDDKMSIAKFLTISYMLCPLVAFTVVGALTACKAIL